MPTPAPALTMRTAAAVTAALLAASLNTGTAALAETAPAQSPTVVSAALTQAQQRQQIASLFNTVNASRAENGFKPLKFGVAATAVLQDYVNNPGQDPAGPDSLEFSKRIRGHSGYAHHQAAPTTWWWEFNALTIQSGMSVIGMVPGTNSMHAVGYKYGTLPSETFDTAEEYFAYIDRTQVTGPTPTVSGDGVWGGTLTVDPGTWPEGTSFAYQWFYTNTDGYSWPVNNEDHPPVSTLFISDVDMRQKLSVRVTATLPDHRANVMFVDASDFIAVPGYVQGPAAVTTTGVAEPGGTLTANPGTWEAGTTLTYQWLNSAGYPLTGETGKTFTFPMDSGPAASAVSVRVTGSKVGKRDTSVTSPQTAVVDLNTVRPFVLVGNPWVDLRGGDAEVGEILTGYDNNWLAGTTLTRQWKRDGVAVPGATTDKYTLTTADIGHRITFVVTGTHPGYNTRTVSSDPTTTIVARRPQVQNTVAPSLIGTGLAGKPFTSTSGTWTPGTKLAYQWWSVNGVTHSPIAGATGTSFTPPAAWHGLRVYLQVTGTLAGYDPKQVQTATSPMISKNIVTAPSIVEKSWFAGDLISATVWKSGAALSYQWKRNGVAIPGATAATYRMGLADIGKTITLTVTGSLPGYPSASATSLPTMKVGQRSVIMTALPTTSWSTRYPPRVGQFLRIMSAGRWSAGATISYQWKLNGVAIKGATRSYYTPPSTAAGKLLTVTVTAKISYWRDASSTTVAAPVRR
ncbi:hypothetical protein [Arthrobacter sp. ISL-65]|uniref:hypothetical protein n=1 Tax=Arthrobacter sp. ISL-65 TaxID=2819112 RepID=UPI001BE67049|nr:hypothetical protein [Arthrobacter sp. ISL-65]MBT2549743.1 hypothetical protein [Arthrobacter sp. ISL-65]